MKPVRYEFQPIVDGWGICLGKGGKWFVVFGDENTFVANGSYRKRRRAKKEITHYIKHGAPWCSRGARARIAAIIQKGNK